MLATSSPGASDVLDDGPAIYVTAVFNSKARENLKRTVLAKVPPFYWGIRPGKNNLGLWERVKKGDYIIFKFDGAYRVSAKVIAKDRNRELAANLWGVDGWGDTWELLFRLDRPASFCVPIDAKSAALGSRQMGLQRLTPERETKAFEQFGGKDGFMAAFWLRL